MYVHIQKKYKQNKKLKNNKRTFYSFLYRIKKQQRKNGWKIHVFDVLMQFFKKKILSYLTIILF